MWGFGPAGFERLMFRVQGLWHHSLLVSVLESFFGGGLRASGLQAGGLRLWVRGAGEFR